MPKSAPIRSAFPVEPREHVARERRLHLIQLAIVVAATLAGVTVVGLAGRSLVSADDRRDAQVQQVIALVRARDLLRSQQVAFWESRAALNADVPRQVRAAVSIGTATFAELARREEDHVGTPEQDAAIRHTLDASQELASLVASRPDGIPLGSSRDRKALAESVAIIDRLERGLADWVANEQVEAAEVTVDEESLVRRLVIQMFVLLGALATAAVIGWRLVERHRRRAIHGLDRRRRKRAAILGTMRDGLFALSPQGIVTEANEAFLSQLVRSRDDVVGTAPAASYWLPEFGDRVSAAARSGLDGRSERMETDFIAPDGSRRPVWATIATRRDAMGRAVGVVVTTRDVTERRRAADALRFVGDERAALARVATAAATQSSDDVFHLAAKEVSQLLGAFTGVVLRFEDRVGYVVGQSGAEDLPSGPIALDGESAASRVRRTGASARADGYQALRAARPEAYSHLPADQVSAAGAPIRVRGRLWGALVAADGHPVRDDARQVLERMADVVGLVVSNAETTAELVSRAATDPLTGLPNHRTFQQQLVAEVERARRHDRPLSVAVLDIDQFKEVNDAHGYQTGDLILTETARRLAEARRPGDLLSRIGGEEFALLMPETGPDEARAIVDHARAKVGAAAFSGGVGHLTLSAGICDLETAGGVPGLWRLVEGALYWAKIHGRDATCVYSPDVVQELSVEERAARLERDRAIAGLRGLARAVDARDASTSRHSERVANLAVLLALRCGWDEQRASALREAAVLHDVGKIGLPDAILFKPGPLTTTERSVVQQHPALGAEIVAGLLDDEQMAWIKHHHERVDGSGYPDRLAGSDIPDGARIIALAEAWDVMVGEKPYGPPRAEAEALAECHERSGSQFDPQLVDALGGLVDETTRADGARERSGEEWA